MRSRKRNQKYSEEKEMEGNTKDAKNRSGKLAFLQKSFSSLCAVVFTCFAIFPILFYSSSSLRRHVLFMNYLDFNSKLNYSNPESLSCFRNIYISSEKGITLGVWHIVPDSLKAKKCSGDYLNQSNEFDDDRPVIMYLHGSGGNRGSPHRVAMYKVLTESELDSHVVTLDYRGFGDSTNLPITVDDFVTDAEVVYKWLVERVDTSRIYIWGHSLGAGVCLRLASTRSTVRPRSIIMESPFANSVEAMRDFPLTMLYRYMPFFQWLFVEPMRGSDINFDNTALIGNVSFPVLILHAKDDIQVPSYQPESLYRIALQNDSTKVTYIEYDQSLGYGHIHISKDPDLPNKILSFMKSFV